MSKKLSGKALVVQVGEAETRVASIVLGAKYPQVLDSVVMPTPEGAVSDGAIENVEAMSGLLAEVRLQPGFKKIRKVLFVLSSTQVISQSASVPKMKNAKKLEQLVRANADMYFPVDISDYQMTWMVAGEKVVEDVPHTQLKMWATPKALLIPYYRLAADCGLTVAAVDYCGHSFASGINASFAAEKSAKPAKGKKRRKNAEEPVAAEELQPLEAETTTLYINLEKDHILMSFVQEDQVLMQRLLQRSEYADTDLNDMFMEMEYFHAEFPACVSGDCVVSGSALADEAFMADLEELAAVPLQWMHCEPDQIWCMCLGASLSELDFGDPSLDPRGGKKRVDLNANVPLQPVFLVLGVLVLAGSLALSIMSNKGWETELQGLRDTQMILNIQHAATDGNAQRYEDYEMLYDAYSADWDNVFQSVRTYNDNLGLILGELEEILPKDSVVTDLSINENSISMTTAFQEKLDVVYFLVALRELEYASLDQISNLQVLTSQPAAGEQMQSGAQSSTSSTLMDLWNAFKGGGADQFLNTASGTEAPPERGDYTDDLIAGALAGTVDPMTVMMDTEFLYGLKADDQKNGRPAGEGLYDFLVDLSVRKAQNKLDPSQLTTEEKAKLYMMMEIHREVHKDDNTTTNPGSGSTIGNTGIGSSTGTTNSGTGTNIGNTGNTVWIPSGEEMDKLLKDYHMTRQELVDGLDNLKTMNDMAILDKHYVKAYSKYNASDLIAQASVKQRQDAIRNLMTNDPLAMHQVFILIQEDIIKDPKDQILYGAIREKLWEEPSRNALLYESTQETLNQYLPGLIDVITDTSVLPKTEELIRSYYDLGKKLAGQLALTTGKGTAIDTGMDFDQLSIDIITGKTKTVPEVDYVVRQMLTQSALEYYETIEAGTSTGNNSTSIGGTISDLIDQFLGGNTGTDTNVEMVEPAGNFGISITLGYKDALIQVEQLRKGLDYDAKIGKLEVAG